MREKAVICYGEVLWDHLPAGKSPGGAPMNVAYHLHKLGVNSHLVSSVGNDGAGKELLEFLQGVGLPTQQVQTDANHATSEVIASMNEQKEVTYQIVAPVAWDFIQWDPAIMTLIQQADAIVFGSLSSRDNHSKTTLFRMLEHAKYRVFDVNLRAPFYSAELISQLLEKCDLVKLNIDELQLIAEWNHTASENEADLVALLFKKYNITEVLITKGSQGATYYNTSGKYNSPAYKIQVADTIGSGDSFLAAFLAMKLMGKPIEEVLDVAVAMGAFITSQSGACPEYSKSDFEAFRQRHNFYNSK